MNGSEPGQWYDIEDMVLDSDERVFENIECPYCRVHRINFVGYNTNT